MNHKLRFLLEGGIELRFLQFDLGETRLLWKNVLVQGKDKLTFAVVADYLDGRLHKLEVSYYMSIWSKALDRPTPFNIELCFDVPPDAVSITARDVDLGRFSRSSKSSVPALLDTLEQQMRTLKRTGNVFCIAIPGHIGKSIEVPVKY